MDSTAACPVYVRSHEKHSVHLPPPSNPLIIELIPYSGMLKYQTEITAINGASLQLTFE